VAYSGEIFIAQAPFHRVFVIKVTLSPAIRFALKSLLWQDISL